MVAPHAKLVPSESAISDSAPTLSDLTGRCTQMATAPLIDLRSIKDLDTLRQIPNDATVTLLLGKADTLSAYGATFDCRTLSRTTKFPGIERRVPAINFFTEEEGCRLAGYAEGTPEGDASFAGTLAWLVRVDGDKEIIEIPIPGTTGKQLPDQIEISGALLKRFVQSIVHEGTHSHGKNERGIGHGEFYAHINGFNVAHQIGLLATPIGPVEVLNHVRANYDHTEVSFAEREFEHYCQVHNLNEVLTAYWTNVEAEQQRDRDLDAVSFGDGDDLDPNVAFDVEFDRDPNFEE